MLIIAKAAMIRMTPTGAAAGRVPQLYEVLSVFNSHNPRVTIPTLQVKILRLKKGKPLAPGSQSGSIDSLWASSGTPLPEAPPHLRRLRPLPEGLRS